MLWPAVHEHIATSTGAKKEIVHVRTAMSLWQLNPSITVAAEWSRVLRVFPVFCGLVQAGRRCFECVANAEKQAAKDVEDAKKKKLVSPNPST